MYTDQQLEDWRTCQKIIVTGRAKWLERNSYKRKELELRGQNNETYFVYLRQNLQPNMEIDFSVGLRIKTDDGQELTLCRYNGSSHNHTNMIEGNKISRVCHIHMATERYIVKGLKADGYAEETSRYSNLESAYICLRSDCNVMDAEESEDSPLEQPKLFS